MESQAKQFELEKKIHAWFLAARPKTFLISLMPTMIASALAYAETGTISWVVSLCTFFAAFFFQIGTNIINDAIDFKKGADTEERLGPLRVTQAGLLKFDEVYRGGILCFAIGALIAMPLIIKGGIPFLAIVIAAVLSGYLYTAGPYPLAYLGLGDLFVFLFYGYAAILGIYFLQTGQISWSAFLAATQAGSLATIPIAIVTLRDIAEDPKANKMTLPVRFGKTFARCEITALIVAPFLLTLLWAQTYPLAALLPWLSFPIALRVIRSIWTHEPSRAYNTFFAQSVIMLFLFGFLLALGFCL